jgi:putative membrane protein
MYKLLAAAAVAVSLATPVLAQPVPEKTEVNSTLWIPSTQDFVTEAAYRDMLEIESSKLVASKFDTKDTGFAEQMIKDHTATSAELEGLVSSGKVKANLPAAMDKAHRAKLDKLKGLDGMAFIKAYEDMQVSAHEEAVSLFERYAKSGDNADLKAFAAKTLPRLEDHLKMAHDLEKLARPS